VYMDIKNKTAAGTITGPELFVVSPQLVGAWPWQDDTISPKAVVTNAAEAEAFVKQFKREGYSEIKITFFVKKPAYDAIIAAAKRENIKVTGHVGPAVKLPAALAAGQQVEHLDEFIDMLLPDSLMGKRVSVSGTNIWNRRAWETVDWLDENKIPALVRQVKQSGIYVTPTQYFFEANFGKGQTDAEITASPDYAFIPASLVEKRNEVRHYYWDSLRISETKIMCGSDSPEWFLVQGFSVHKELEALAAAGLTNFEALQTATVNPAAYLGINGRTGTIEEGKEADLILLDKNPLENISNTKTVSGVFSNGKWYSQPELQKLITR
jgi:Amidohydrolase family